MDDSAIKAALQHLLSQGGAHEDAKLMSRHAAKNAPPPDMCPECKTPLVDGRCTGCGYEKPGSGNQDDGEMASLLERGSQE